MRTTFVKTLTEQARQNKLIYLITGDLGFMVMEPFRDEFKNRFINIGVQEANMLGVASGLAMTGKIVYVYSIIPFLVFRALEQIRNDVCYHKLNVRIVGVGAGFSYGIMGSTHHALEDVGVMKSIPNMTVICPGDPVEVASAVRASVSFQGPLYLRLGKAGEPVLHPAPIDFKVGKANIVRDGKDLTLISTGNMLETALQVAQMIETEKAWRTRVVSMHTVQPIDSDIILRCARDTSNIFSLEEHIFENGLGYSVSAVLAQSSIKNYSFYPFAAKNGFAEVVGRQEHLRKLQGLDPLSIKEKILSKCTEWRKT